LVLRPGTPHPFSGMDLPWLLAQRAATRRDHAFLVWAPPDGAVQTWTYGQFVDRVQRLAAGLVRRGLKPGDALLIHLDNCPEALLAWYACAWAGVVAVTTNARSVADDLAYFADHVGAVAAITQPRFAPLVAQSCKGLRWMAVTAHDNGDPPAAPVEPAQWFDAIDDFGQLAPLPQRPPNPLAPCSVQFTSGTTSRPKAVLWTHANALWGARVNATHEDLRATDVHLTFLPLFHTNAQAYSVLATLWAGGTVVVQPRFSASRFWAMSLQHRCTWVSLIPFCVKALMAQDKPAAHHYRQWGSAVNDPPTDAHFGVKTMGWWGMTETITHGIVGNPHLPNVPLSIGRPAPEYEIAVVDSDARPVRDSRAIEPGGSGHLWVRQTRGLGLFAEYLGNAKATADAFDPEGWFNTGDMIKVLPDGSLQFGDRHKDMLKVGGENVAASEIERVVLQIPGVHECAVVAQKHPMLDEVPVLFIRPAECAQGRALSSLAADALDALQARAAAACAAQLADFKRPAEIRLIEDFPRSTLEKIAKAQLREMLKNRSP
jgi:crotonobetaine/carnitine-CoA ligase